MFRSGLHYLLILLITGQSLMAVAGLPSLDQFGAADNGLSYQLELLNEIDAASAKSRTNQTLNFTAVDCLDCGCCYLALFTVNLNTSFDGLGHLLTDYESSIIEILRPPFLRPPKI